MMYDISSNLQYHSGSPPSVCYEAADNRYNTHLPYLGPPHPEGSPNFSYHTHVTVISTGRARKKGQRPFNSTTCKVLYCTVLHLQQHNQVCFGSPGYVVEPPTHAELFLSGTGIETFSDADPQALLELNKPSKEYDDRLAYCYLICDRWSYN